MAHSTRARPPARRIPTILAGGLLVLIAGTLAALSHQLLPPSSSSSAATSPSEVLRSDDLGALAQADAVVPHGTMPVRGGHHTSLGEADGVVPEGTTVFHDEVPAVANLDPALVNALRRASTDAAADGVVLFVESGWRSAEYQVQLLREAVSMYGSEEESARWVASPDTSAHVSGEAVDIGHTDAAGWLAEQGAEYGLCQTYANEPWHYELRPEAVDRGCPPMYADPTQHRRAQH